MATSRAKKGNLLCLDQIILQDVPKLKYTLRLLVDNEERELQKEDKQTWAPAQRLDIFSLTSQLRVEIRINSAHLPWVQKAQASQEIEIDLQGLFNDYWTSKAHEFALLEEVAVGKHTAVSENLWTEQKIFDKT